MNSKIRKKALTHAELFKLPIADRNRILHAQAKKAEWIYEHDKDLIFPDGQDIIEY